MSNSRDLLGKNKSPEFPAAEGEKRNQKTHNDTRKHPSLFSAVQSQVVTVSLDPNQFPPAGPRLYTQL